MSTNTGRAPSLAIEPAVAKNENGVVTTSSPAPTPSAINAASSASVPDETTHGMRNAQERLELALERFDFGAQNELLRIADTRDGLEHTARAAARTAL